MSGSPLPWIRYDAFQIKKKTSQTNLHFEKASMMFNLAAVVSQLALACDRATGEGLKQACALFQVCTEDGGCTEDACEMDSSVSVVYMRDRD